MRKFLISKPTPDKSRVESESRNEVQHVAQQNPIHIDLKNLPMDPGLRVRILDYPPNERDSIRRAYLQKGPCQPRLDKYPTKLMGKKQRGFCSSWYDVGSDWVEYSLSKNAVFCLHCYVFGVEAGDQGGESFVVDGYSNWKKKYRLQIYEGGLNSAHNKAYEKAQALMNQKKHIKTFFCRQSDKARADYRIRLKTSISCSRFLLRQGLAFRGHDEHFSSNNQGNFLELLKYIAEHDEAIKNVILNNAPENLKLTSPKIQKDIVNAAVVETTNTILKELGDSLFCVLVDESRDVSVREQMAVVLRYVTIDGCLVERFLSLVHVTSTSALSLKAAIDALFSKHGLSFTRLRGQGYDGASNMQGEFNGLKALILKENGSAYSIHCFAHQLQLALVGVAKHVGHVATFFNNVSMAVNIAGASCKRRDILREKEAARVIEALNCGELQSGQGLNQEIGLKRPGDTRWGSHYMALLNLIHLFPSVIDVLDGVVVDGSSYEQRGEARSLLISMQAFDFVLILHLMTNILGITNELSKALQRKDQDIVNAMTLVEVSKQRLQLMRDNGWEPLEAEVSSFCLKNRIVVPKMDEQYEAHGRSRRNVEDITHIGYFRREIFYRCIDTQREELKHRFNEVNMELLICMACLNPDNAFVAYDKEKLTRLAEFYQSDFSVIERMALPHQLENYIFDMRRTTAFLNLNGITDLAIRMVETKKNIVYPLVFLLIKLALILPVATATVERAFSVMHIIKSKLRNRMGDEWLNDCLVTNIEKDIFNSIEDEAIIQRFQNMKTRRGQL